MYMPPLTCSTAPGDVAAAGRGEVGDRGGDVLRRAEPPERNLLEQRLSLLVRQRARHVGVDEARRHAVHRDVAAAELARERLGHADHAGLRRRVVRLPRVAGGADHRGDVDDASPARLHHAAHHRARQAEDRAQVGLDHLVPVLVLHAQRQVVARDAGVVDEDVDVAELLLDRFDHAHRICAASRTSSTASDAGRLLAPIFAPLARRGADDVAPPARSSSAIARPMPREAPVTSATCRTFPASISVPLRAMRGRRPQRARVDAGRDALGHAGEHLARAAFDDVRDAGVAIAWIVSTQRTGDAAWRTSASVIAAGSASIATSTLFITGIRGARCARARDSPCSFSAAGCISVEWNGALTGSGIARFAPRALHSSIARSTAAFSPAITTCPGALKFTGCDHALRRLDAGRAHRVVVEHEDRGHRALPFGHRFLHRLRAEAHQRQRIAEGHRAGRDQRGVFAEAVPGDHRRRRAAERAPRAIGGDARRSASPAACSPSG